MGQSNAISVLAAGGKIPLKAPDMYMEKISGGFKCKGIIDLNLPLNKIFAASHLS